MRKLKYAIMITRSEKGGAQANVACIIKNLSKIAEVHLIVGGEDNDLASDFLIQEARNLGARIHIVRNLVARVSLTDDIRAIIKTFLILNQIKPDLVHSHSTKAGLVGRVSGRLLNIPSVFTAHGWAFTDGAPTRRKKLAVALEKFVSILTDRIISVSDYDTTLARQWNVGGPKQITTIQNGIPDLSIHKTPRSTSQRSLRVVMTARFATPKNQSALLRAAALLSGIEIWLVGDGPQLDAAKSLAYELGISERVQFLGNRSDVPEILSQADAFALISDYEGFPISTLEAMRAALPVIVSDVGGAAEAVMPGVTGFVVPKGDVQAIADALKILAEQPERRESMGIAGRARFLSRYQEKDMIDKTFRVYEEVLSERGVN